MSIMGKTSPTFEEWVAEARRRAAPEIERVRQEAEAIRADPNWKQKRDAHLRAFREKYGGKMRIYGDIVGPTGEKWHAEEGRLLGEDQTGQERDHGKNLSDI